MASHPHAIELQWLSAVTEARRSFNDALLRSISGKKDLSARILTVLQNDHTYHIVAFYYLCRELSLLHSDNIKVLIARHNADIDALKADPERLSRLNLERQIKNMGKVRKTRLDKSRFTDAAIKSISKQSRQTGDGYIYLSVSELDRFLAPVMAGSTCRESIDALVFAGLVELSNPGRSGARVIKAVGSTRSTEPVFIKSTGSMEEIFHNHLVYGRRVFAGQESS